MPAGFTRSCAFSTLRTEGRSRGRSSEYNVRHATFSDGRVVAQTHGGKEIPFETAKAVVDYIGVKRKNKDDLKGMTLGATLGSVNKLSAYPYHPRMEAYGSVVDAGSFAQAHVAKAGIVPVTQSLSLEGKAGTQPLGFEGYEAKSSMCQALKGGGNPPCRVQLTSTPDNTSMAIRLCDKIGDPGTVIPVKDAQEALVRSREFCKCARYKPDGVRKKCARKMVSG